MKLSIVTLTFISILASYPSAFAFRSEGPSLRVERPIQASVPEVLNWVGIVNDKSEDHTTEHMHRLTFVTESGDQFKVVDSPELVKLHHETGKSFVIQAEIEKTPRFLFWGGNIRVRSFKVLQEGSPKPHVEVCQSSSEMRSLPIRAKL